jgi:cell volume regulation protein A
MTVRDVILTITLILGAGLVSQLVADYLRAPRMLVLLLAGALLGPSVSGAIEVPLDSMGPQLLLTIGVSFILFHGGLQLSTRVLSRVVVGLLMLVVPGVILTAAITGGVAASTFSLPLSTGLLMGAALAPTDPAILIPLFERIRLRPKISQTIIAESALNDPVGAVLALAIAAFVLKGGGSLADPFGRFLVDLAVSTALGVAFGVILAVTVSTRALGIWRETPAVAVLFLISASYFSIDSAGGSGYLGAFIAGLIVGNMDVLRLGMHSEREAEMRFFAGASADIVVIFVFVTLGANLPFDRFGSDALPALATLAVLIAVARPLTVVACLAADRRGRWEQREIAFIAWTRETGVVPAAVAGILVAQGVSYANEIVTTVALAVIVTLALQATTKRWLARRLELLDLSAPPLGSTSAG